MSLQLLWLNDAYDVRCPEPQDVVATRQERQLVKCPGK